MKRSGFLLPFEQQFGEQQQLVVETDVADVVAARGDAGGTRGLVGDVVVNCSGSWTRVKTSQLDNMRN